MPLHLNQMRAPDILCCKEICDIKSSQILPCDPPPPWPPLASCCIWFKTMLLAFKAVERTVPVFFQTQVGPHAPARTSLSSISWLTGTPHHWEQTKLTQRSRRFPQGCHSVTITGIVFRHWFWYHKTYQEMISYCKLKLTNLTKRSESLTKNIFEIMPVGLIQYW